MDTTWKLSGKSLDETKLREAGTKIASEYEGVSVTIEREDKDFITLFFAVPWDAESDEGHAEVEITVYDMGRDGLVLSLEADAADNNNAWDDASQLAEDLASHFNGVPIDV